jgi:hypothetical protein
VCLANGAPRARPRSLFPSAVGGSPSSTSVKWRWISSAEASGASANRGIARRFGGLGGRAPGPRARACRPRRPATEVVSCPGERRGRRMALAGLDDGRGGRQPGRPGRGRPDVGSRGWPGSGVGKPGSGVKIGQRAHLELHRGLEVAGGVRQDDGGRCVRAREQELLRPDPRAREQRAPGRELPGSPLPRRPAPRGTAHNAACAPANRAPRGGGPG